MSNGLFHDLTYIDCKWVMNLNLGSSAFICNCKWVMSGPCGLHLLCNSPKVFMIP